MSFFEPNKSIPYTGGQGVEKDKGQRPQKPPLGCDRVWSVDKKKSYSVFEICARAVLKIGLRMRKSEI